MCWQWSYDCTTVSIIQLQYKYRHTQVQNFINNVAQNPHNSSPSQNQPPLMHYWYQLALAFKYTFKCKINHRMFNTLYLYTAVWSWAIAGYERRQCKVAGKWMQTNQSELKAKKTYIVNFTSSKAPIWLLTITHVDQTLAVAETNKSLGLLWTVTYHGSLT